MRIVRLGDGAGPDHGAAGTGEDGRLGIPGLVDFARRTDYALRVDSRASHGIYLIESLLLLERALVAGHRPRAVLSLPGSAAVAAELLDAHGADAPVYVGDPELVSEITGYQLHRGTVASFDRPELPPVDRLLADARRVVVVENVVDPTNVGAIFRSAAGIGADAVLVTPRCADPYYRRAIRVSMGTVLQVPWTRSPDWPELRSALDAAGFTVAALALTDTAMPIREYTRQSPERLALVLGTEGEGLSTDALAAADVHVQIPMRHGVDSLNVAAAAAVAMYALAVPEEGAEPG